MTRQVQLWDGRTTLSGPTRDMYSGFQRLRADGIRDQGSQSDSGVRGRMFSAGDNLSQLNIDT